MFSLIITIIAIALVAALAVSSIYYGGSAFNKGTAAADAATIVNGAQQVNAAIALSTVDGNTTHDLVADGYLTSMPAGLSLNGTSIEGTVANVTVCNEINDMAGLAAKPVDATGVTSYGCFGADDDNNSFVWK